MKTKQTFVYGARNFFAIAVVLALAFTALALTGCPNDPGGSTGGKTTPTTTPTTNPTYPNWMVKIPAGTFTMGSNDAQDSIEGATSASPPHSVTLTSFYLGKYEVTQKEYTDVMGSLPSSLSSDTYGKGNNYPVYYVSWYDALVYCNKLSIKEGLTPAYSINGKTNPTEWGAVPTTTNATWNAVTIVSGSKGYRLPTEAQWEYACRAKTTTAWHCGAADTNLGEYAWYSANSGDNGGASTNNGKSHEVGKKKANAFGLYDMHGNVWEWCWDWYEAYADPAEAKTDPVGASSGSDRVERGGSWNDTAQCARSAFRAEDDPYGYTVGFRLLRPAQ